ncbi:hypothetical protein [Bacteriovorax sp. Seq25_V]|uniref:hypothetical protein n=1 Tax=Bacteriovorax sp. Seq25_V TaxID=1201288 RepID=UPI00038A4EAD|nr:hypothetical protein [Bacteriovorax sp. Seq25_V]EQC44006.1 hypothetical protein M900_1506 [Bacteriovorax sp. Seq25_V]
MKVDYLKEDEETKAVEEKKDSPRRILVGGNGKTRVNDEVFDQDVLIVVSKLKKYVKDKHGLNTSGDVFKRLSDIVRVACDRACERSKQDGRKTLMEKDF